MRAIMRNKISCVDKGYNMDLSWSCQPEGIIQNNLVNTMEVTYEFVNRDKS